jgi:hypothetical protein
LLLFGGPKADGIADLHRGRTYRKPDRIATMTRKPRGDDRDSA